MTGVDLRGRLVLTVPEAGRLLWGLGRDASYAAAERGEIPCRTVGRRKVVPTHAALKKLGMSDHLIALTLGLADPLEGDGAEQMAAHAEAAGMTPGLRVVAGAGSHPPPEA